MSKDELAKIASDIQFENDFGQEALALGRITKDQGVIAVVSLAAAFVGSAIAGVPLALVVLAVGLNDIGAVNRLRQTKPKLAEENEPEAIDVPARAVEPNVLPTANDTHPTDSTPLSKAESDRPSASPVPIGTSASNSPSSTKWLNNFICQTALIFGNQGSGKSWMARYIAKLKKERGYRVVVLDTDSNRAEWEGVESYHDLEEIVQFLIWYVEELKRRYKEFNSSDMTEEQWRSKLWAEGKAIAVLCEEVTTYIDLVDDKELLNQFFRLGLTKSRKQEMPLTFVSHNNTQSALGGIKGLSSLIEKMLQLELQTYIDPETLQPTSSGKGAVKLDGSTQWVPVVLPKLEKKITNFGEPQPKVRQHSARVNDTQDKKDPESEAVAPTETTTELKLSDSLKEPLKSIWLFAKEQDDWVFVRDIQRKTFAVLKGKSSKEIHRYLGLLADMGYGQIDEEGKSDSSVGFLAN